ncbi:hypothetical protein [Thalassiella azotivora]
MSRSSRHERGGATAAAVTQAIPAVVAAGADLGVIDARWFLAFHGYPVIWLVTATDEAKVAVTEHGLLRPQVMAALQVAGVRLDLVEQTQVTVESEETVKRDFEGSWFNAMK